MKKIILIAIAFSVMWSFFLFNANQVGAVRPSDYSLKDGDLISAIFSDDPDVYIINNQGYKRLFLNPEIFKFYGHLGGFMNVKLVSPEVRDSFTTSGLFRNCEDNDQKVYGVDVGGEDSAYLHWINTTGDQAVKDDPGFFKKVFCINSKEFNWYSKGTTLTTVKDVPKYERTEKIKATAVEKKLDTVSPLKEESKVVICHYSSGNLSKSETLTVGTSAIKAHLAHGDVTGACPDTTPTSIPTPSPTQTPTTTLTPTPTVSPTNITVVYPNGGEILQKGTTQIIKWKSANVSKIYIKLGKGGDTYHGSEGMITDVIPNSGGYHTWTIPTTLPDGSDYYIRIVDGNSTGVYDDNDALFSIISSITPTPTPTPISCTPITVSLSPTTPQLQHASPGQVGVSLVIFDIKASCYVTLNSFAVSLLPMPSGYQNISSSRLYDNASGVQLGSTIAVSGAGLNFTGLHQPILPDHGLSLKVVGDMKSSANIGSTVYAVFGGSSATDSAGTFVGNNASGNIIAGNVVTIAASITKSNQSNNLATFSRNLTIGSSGNDVKQLQALLANEVGYSADLITGYFGQITRDAVKRLQEKYGIKPIYGYFGEITRKALGALISGQ